MKYKELWQKLEKETEGFEKTILLKGVFSDLSSSHEVITDVFSKLKNEDYSQAMRSVRVFNDYTLESTWTQNIVQSETRPGENISNWMKRSLETDERFIILNNAERLSEKLAANVVRIVEPLSKDYSFPCMICEANLILGKYSLTPLGIHCDSSLGDWHRVFQINMGPGKKKMHFWKREKLQELMGASLKNFFVSKEKLTDLVQYGESYELEVGDALFFNPEEYHIAESDEFSVSLGLVLFNEDKNVFQQKALNEYVEEVLCGTAEETETVSVQNKSNDFLQLPQSKIDPLIDQSWLRKALSDFRLKYYSNSHLKSIPLKKHFPYTNIVEMKGKVISLNQPFKMIYQSNEEEVDVFIRGQKLMLVNIPRLDEMIDRLNKGDVLSMSELLALFDKYLEEESIVFLLKKFYEYGGIKID